MVCLSGIFLTFPAPFLVSLFICYDNICDPPLTISCPCVCTLLCSLPRTLTWWISCVRVPAWVCLVFCCITLLHYGAVSNAAVDDFKNQGFALFVQEDFPVGTHQQKCLVNYLLTERDHLRADSMQSAHITDLQVTSLLMNVLGGLRRTLTFWFGEEWAKEQIFILIVKLSKRK